MALRAKPLRRIFPLDCFAPNPSAILIRDGAFNALDEEVDVDFAEALQDGFPTVADVAAGVDREVVEEGVEGGFVGKVNVAEFR